MSTSDESFWGLFTGEIDAGRPVELLIDTEDSDALPDHFVTAIGYDSSTAALKYACYNTWDQSVHWYAFGFPSQAQPYGVYGGAFCDPGLRPGDANDDGKVDGADLAVWQRNYDPLGVNGSHSFATGDWNEDGKIDGADLALWQQNYDPLGVGLSVSVSAELVGFSEVPEPASASLVVVGAIGWFGFCRRIRRSREFRFK
jgi:hypothetical protein